MNNTLGIDLGSNSLGWAVLDNATGDVADCGVVVFPEGIDPANDTLETPAAIRRAKRMARRIKFRRKMRKWRLLALLIDNGMCPMTREELAAWKKDGAYPVGNAAFLAWLKSTDLTNPYADRAAAASGKVEPFVLGRALYHIGQRRGFKSNRKDLVDTGDEKADEKANAERQGKVAGGIAKLDAEIRAAGCTTLGQYFAKVIDEQKGLPAKSRVRCRYTSRLEHYEAEFAAIMDAQGLDPELRGQLHEAIFHQRPLRSQSHLVGNCPLEPKSPRCRISHPAYEEFRMLSFVNNLSFEKADDPDSRIPLSPEDRAEACKAFFVTKRAITFGDITKQKYFKAKFKAENLKFHYYRDDQSVSSCSMRHRLRLQFGDVAFDEQKVFDALCFFEDETLLAAWFAKHYPSLPEARVKKVMKIQPQEGYAAYSLKAINKMLPFLREGLGLSDARLMARLPDVVPDFAARKEEIWTHVQELQAQYRADRDAPRRRLPRAAVPAVKPFLERCRDYFLDEIGLDESQWNALYLRGDSAYETDPNRPDRVPKVELGMIRNPLVQRSMTVLRRLVNYLRDHGKIDAETTIRLELARGVNDYATRHAIQRWQKTREDARAEARAELGANASEETIDRYILWKEQNETCLYTGDKIELSDLLAGTAFDVEHTIPRSRSGDDSLANKTLCEIKYNRETKKGQIPTECANWDEIYVRLSPWREKVAALEKTYAQQNAKARRLTDPEAKSKARIEVLVTRLERDYWRDKLRRFTVTADRLSDPETGLGGFKRRQLVDTGVMSAHAIELLGSVYRTRDGSRPNVYAVNGAATAFARKAWGIQGDEAKDRSNHVHHAKDAMVIAALTPKCFNAICTALKDEGLSARVRECDVCPPPYDGFAEKVRRACEGILVKHVVRSVTLRQSQKRNCLAKPHESKKEPGKIVKHVLSRGDTVRGPLHKETFYGKIRNPADGKIITVERAKLEGDVRDVLKWSKDIIDPAIRNIVVSALDDFLQNGKTKFVQGEIKMPSGVPIRRVRVKAASTFQDPWPVKAHAYVSNKEYKRTLWAASAADSNFRMALIVKNGKLTFKTESVFSWAKQHKDADYLPADKQKGFLGYVRPGAMVLIHSGGGTEELRALSEQELNKRLYIIRTFPTDKDNHVELQFHKAAGAKKDIKDRSSDFDFANPHAMIRAGAGKVLSHTLFEGIHFKMMLDGTIRFV